MLAGKAGDKIAFPVLVSPKLDGVRALNVGGMMRSRALKAFGNVYTQGRFSMRLFDGFDGEFILDEPTAADVYRKTNSALARHEGSPQMTWWVFDDYTSTAGFSGRFSRLKDRVDEARDKHTLDIRVLPHLVVADENELAALETEWVQEGYEGIMIRSFFGDYKQGRSTTREGALLKLKRFDDMEAHVVGIEEEMHNANEATISEVGRTKRSTHKANLQGKGTTGALIVRGILGSPFAGVEFKVGSGFTAEDRARTDWVGKIIKVKYFAVGVKDKPRHPVFMGERMKEDM